METDLKNNNWNRFYGISCEGPVLMEQVLKHADIRDLSNFLAFFIQIFSRYQEILRNTIYIPNFRSIGQSEQKLQRGAESAPPLSIPICKKPGLFRVKDNTVLHLTDIPRQREEYEVIYGTRRNAECHIISILRAGVEYLFYFMTNSRYIFVTK